jgi:hypothetical protein
MIAIADVLVHVGPPLAPSEPRGFVVRYESVFGRRRASGPGQRGLVTVPGWTRWRLQRIPCGLVRCGVLGR